MNVLTIVVVCGISMIVTACASGPRVDFSDPQSIRSEIKVERDDFKKLTNFQGPNASGNILDNVLLRAWKFDRTGTTSYQIYVADYYTREWRFYDSAYDSRGTRLDATLISRDVSSCSRYGCGFQEHIGINVSRQYLEENKATGIRFKISGKAGEEIFYIPSAYVKAFLLATT